MQDTRREQIALRGFGVIQLAGESVFDLRQWLMHEICMPLGDFDHPDFYGKQKHFLTQLHKRSEWENLVRDNIEQIEAVVGSNLRMQREPYLRIARPGRTADQVGIHRDTHYGATDSEWVLWVPLTPAVNGAELTFIPGSHLAPEEAYPWAQEKHTEIERGSDKHFMGFMYAPKKMGADVESQCEPVACDVGEAILFNCACVHGQNVNASKQTRFSIDIRLVNGEAKVNPHGIHGEFYQPARIQ